jgi:hypothetical protein
VIRTNAFVAGDDHGLERGDVFDGRDFIFAEVGDVDASILDRQIFDQTVANSLHDSALDLSLMAPKKDFE